MFEESQPDNKSTSENAYGEDRALDIRSIMRKSIDLPAEILNADFSHFQDRILDQNAFSMLTDLGALEADNAKISERYACRKRALAPYLDRRLICVCIHVPGVMYTIEIDPEAKELVHWEWQST